MAYVLHGSVSIDMAEFWAWFSATTGTTNTDFCPEVFIEDGEVLAVTVEGDCFSVPSENFWTFVYRYTPELFAGNFQLSRPVFGTTELNIDFIAATGSLDSYAEPHASRYRDIKASWQTRTHPAHCVSAEIYAGLKRETQQAIFTLLQQMLEDGCQPNLTRRGDSFTYRGYVNVSGNYWEDDTDPMIALECAYAAYLDSQRTA